MSRPHYTSIPNVPVSALLLDTLNPRIRTGQDQADCMARILNSRKPFLNLVRDIAKNGLTPEHIIVTAQDDGSLVVRDGNRRVAALKLLNDPRRCEDEAIRKQVAELQRLYADRIPTHVDVLECNDEKVLLEYLQRKHTGENEGIGQKDWSSLLISLFRNQHFDSDQHKRSAQLLLWLEERGFELPDDFEITTLTRILNKESLGLLGFEVVADALVPALSDHQAYALGARVANDIMFKRINVRRDGEAGSVYESAKALDYIKRIRDEVGPPVARPDPEPAEDEAPFAEEGVSGAGAGPSARPGSPDNSAGGDDGAGETAGSPNEPSPANEGEGPVRGATGPKKAPWDRARLMGPKGPGFPIPDSELKARGIVFELKKLDMTRTPLAGAMLLRAFIEASQDYYREKHGLQEKSKLRENILVCLEHMVTQQVIDKKLEESVRRYTVAGPVSNDHIATLQKILHRKEFMPAQQSMNTFWDELRGFLEKCWTA